VESSLPINATVTPDVLRAVLSEYHWGTPDRWGVKEEGAIKTGGRAPALPTSALPGSIGVLGPREIAVREIAERWGLEKGDVKLLVETLNIPDVRTGGDGENVGVWRERGGAEGYG
jgi:hypothetical protein